MFFNELHALFVFGADWKSFHHFHVYEIVMCVAIVEALLAIEQRILIILTHLWVMTTKKIVYLKALLLELLNFAQVFDGVVVSLHADMTKS